MNFKTKQLFAAALVVYATNSVVSMAHCATGQLLAGTAKVSLTPETDEPIHDPVYILDILGAVASGRDTCPASKEPPWEATAPTRTPG